MQPGSEDRAIGASDPETTGPAEDEVSALRAILFESERQRLDMLQAALVKLEHRTSDDDALIETITPVMGDIIRENIRSNRDEMIEALYPIIGQLVVRAVAEAVRGLAENIDAQMRSTFRFDNLWYQLRARTVGVSPAEAVMRRSLPFTMTEIFLIHRETGLVLWYTAHEGDEQIQDSDIIGGMLTAIRDFAADTIGKGRDGQLDEIRFGGREILIETASDVYVAVVFEGVEPAGFREYLRGKLIDLSHRYRQILRHYDGDAAPLAPAGRALAATLFRYVKTKQAIGRATRQRHVRDKTLYYAALGFYVLIILIAVTVVLIAAWQWLTTR